jgi:ParB-like chromosome segregation protein Spo0J
LTAPKTNLLPPLTDEEYAALKASIADGGYWSSNPVVVDEHGDILDGHNRARACHELGVEYPTVVRKGLSDWEKVDYAVRSNVTRRQLSTAQRRQLLKRLKEEYDKVLRAEAAEAKKAGSEKGARASVQVRTKAQGDSKRNAAAEAAETRFDEPVVPIPKPASKDRLSVLGGMLGVSRSTAHADEKILARMETIEEAAEAQHRDDVVRMLNAPRPNLDLLERAVGLRDPLPDAEPEEDLRFGWVHNLAQALNNLAPALTDAEADVLWGKIEAKSTVLVQLGQLRGAVAEAKQRGR